MLKQAQLAGITIVLVVASTAGGVYLWWQSTPQFALMEARKGYLQKEAQRFNKYVDVATLTTGFTEEIIFEPAERTPRLTKLQRIIGLGAVHAARTGIDNSLIFQIQNLVHKDQEKKVIWPIKPVVDPTEDVTDQAADGVIEKKIKKITLGDEVSSKDSAIANDTASGADCSTSGRTINGGKSDAANGDKPDSAIASKFEAANGSEPEVANGSKPETPDGSKTDTANGEPACGGEKKKFWQSRPKGFGTLVRMQWRKEKQRLKNQTIERMSEFARNHPNTLINRIFAAPRGGRANAVKEILAECGFKATNFKKYQLEKKGSKVIAHLTFFSPRIKDLVTVKLELERVRQTGPFGRYRVSRLVDFKNTLNDLDYDTDSQIQGLVGYGLQDLNGQTIAGKAKEVMRAIGAVQDAEDDDDDDDDNDDLKSQIKTPPDKTPQSNLPSAQL